MAHFEALFSCIYFTELDKDNEPEREKIYTQLDQSLDFVVNDSHCAKWHIEEIEKKIKKGGKENIEQSILSVDVCVVDHEMPWAVYDSDLRESVIADICSGENANTVHVSSITIQAVSGKKRG